MIYPIRLTCDYQDCRQTYWTIINSRGYPMLWYSFHFWVYKLPPPSIVCMSINYMCVILSSFFIKWPYYRSIVYHMFYLVLATWTTQLFYYYYYPYFWLIYAFFISHWFPYCFIIFFRFFCRLSMRHVIVSHVVHFVDIKLLLVLLIDVFGFMIFDEVSENLFFFKKVITVANFFICGTFVFFLKEHYFVLFIKLTKWRLWNSFSTD